MSAESLDKEAKAALTGGAIGSFVTACLCVCLWAISQSKTYQPETYQTGEVAAGTTVIPGCPDTVQVVTFQRGAVLNISKRNVAEGFSLEAGNGKHWHIKVIK